MAYNFNKKDATNLAVLRAFVNRAVVIGIPNCSYFFQLAFVFTSNLKNGVITILNITLNQ